MDSSNSLAIHYIEPILRFDIAHKYCTHWATFGIFPIFECYCFIKYKLLLNSLRENPVKSQYSANTISESYVKSNIIGEI